MRHQYVVPGVVDESVVKAQAERRLREEHERSLIHKHKYREACTNECYEVGDDS